MYTVAFFIRRVVTLTVVVLNLFNNQTGLAAEGFYIKSKKHVLGAHTSVSSGIQSQLLRK